MPPQCLGDSQTSSTSGSRRWWPTQGLSLREIAAELVRRGIKARHGRVQWSAAQVRRVLQRARHNSAQMHPKLPFHQRVIQTGTSAAPPQKLTNTNAPGGNRLKNAEDPSPELLRKVDASGDSASLQITVSLGGRTVGPLSIEQVRVMIADGTATPITLARVNGGPWQRLGAVLGTETAKL